MFVFPAFNGNYKSRKRTFRCCNQCRTKRIKCDISASDFESVGCTNCRKHKFRCDLIAKVSGSVSSASADSDTPIMKEDSRLGEVESSSIKDYSTSRTSSFLKNSKSPGSIKSEEMIEDSKQITPLYLKNKFNFNISGQDSSSNYQYVYHDHPKAIISNKITDRSVYHESGVYVDLTSKIPEQGIYKPYKVKNFGGSEKEIHIKDKRIYHFLVSMDAFTLSGPAYQFKDSEINQLVELYFYKINSIFPIVHEKRFRDDFQEDKAQTILVFALVLVILRDQLAEPILRSAFRRGRGYTSELTENEFHNDYINFITDLEYKIRQILLILPELGDTDKLTKLVVHLLLSLHFKFDKLGNEHSSHDLTVAINLAGSLGMQMKSTAKNISKEKEEYSNNIWWCCYIFDRFNAVVNSRFVFIRAEDFNVELPYTNPTLLKFVQLARSFENMLFSVYQPFNNSHRENDTKELRNKIFDVDEFQKIEFEICDNERANIEIYEQMNFSYINEKFDLRGPYIETITHFYTRLVNNTVILASQKSKYDDSNVANSIPDAIALKAALNVLFYLTKMKREILLNIPLVPWCITIAMSCALKKRARDSLKSSQGIQTMKPDEGTFDLEDYMKELERFAAKWWVVDELNSLCKEFVHKLNHTSKSKVHLKKLKEANISDSVKRRKHNEVDNTDSNIKASNTLSQINHGFGSYSSNLQVPSQNSLSRAPSIKNVLQNSDELFDKQNNITCVLENIYSPQLPQINPIFTNGGRYDFDEQSEGYDTYLETMHIDMFDTEFFKDLPNVINFLP